MKPAIEIKGLSKKYRKGSNAPYLTLRDSLVSMFSGKKSESLSKDEFWAIKDINLEIKPGEVVGVIGHNGAGKSTLLKILSRITHPTEGEVVIRGRVGSLLEVGTGFHQELTGRENIYLNGAVLGMSRLEINNKLDEIIDFAEIKEFIDTPVKHYSSGMYMRLAFSVAAHLESEVLLVDEVLAVGDAKFQEKSLDKMNQISKQGRTILFVSHNIRAIKSLCEKCVVMSKGAIEYFGETEKGISYYLEKINSKNYSSTKLIKFPDNGIAQIQNIRITQENKEVNNEHINANLDLSIEIQLMVFEKTTGLRLYIDLLDQFENLIVRTAHDSLKKQKHDLAVGKHLLYLIIPKCTLAPKKYITKIVLTVFNSHTLNPDGIRIPLEVSEASSFNSLYPEEEIRGLLAPCNFIWGEKE